MAEHGRDQFGRLRCRFPMCKSTIGGVTGLDEIRKLVAHVRRKHGQAIDMATALELRGRWEEPDIVGADDHRVTAKPVRPATERESSLP